VLIILRDMMQAYTTSVSSDVYGYAGLKRQCCPSQVN